jgi:hypothetical protein
MALDKDARIDAFQLPDQPQHGGAVGGFRIHEGAGEQRQNERAALIVNHFHWLGVLRLVEGYELYILYLVLFVLALLFGR